MTKIIGILNITPDSFSDGKAFYRKQDAINHTHHLIDSGVDIIDIGAESTRPGAKSISENEEWRRLKEPLSEIIKIAHQNKIEISIDTRNLSTIKLVTAMGVNYINDVSSSISCDKINILNKSNTKFIITHNLGIPANRDKVLNDSENPIEVVIKDIGNITSTLINNNLKKDRIVIDPGIGFGKNSKQSWNIIKNINSLKALKFPICVGHSRKSMFENIATPINRDNTTLAVSVFLLQNNIDYIRIHNVKLHTEFFTILKKLTEERL